MIEQSISRRKKRSDAATRTPVATIQTIGQTGMTVWAKMPTINATATGMAGRRGIRGEAGLVEWIGSDMYCWGSRARAPCGEERYPRFRKSRKDFRFLVGGNFG